MSWNRSTDQWDRSCERPSNQDNDNARADELYRQHFDIDLEADEQDDEDEDA